MEQLLDLGAGARVHGWALPVWSLVRSWPNLFVLCSLTSGPLRLDSAQCRGTMSLRRGGRLSVSLEP